MDQHHQRLLCSASYSPRQDWRQHPAYFPPSPPTTTTTNSNNNNNNHSWIRPSSSYEYFSFLSSLFFLKKIFLLFDWLISLNSERAREREKMKTFKFI